MAVLPNFLATAIAASFQAADGQADFPKSDFRRVSGNWRGVVRTYKVRVLLPDAETIQLYVVRKSD